MLKRYRDSTFMYDQPINYKIPKYNDNENFNSSDNNKIKQLLDSILLKLDKLDKDIKIIDANFKELSQYINTINTKVQPTNYYNLPCSYIS